MRCAIIYEGTTGLWHYKGQGAPWVVVFAAVAGEAMITYRFTLASAAEVAACTADAADVEDTRECDAWAIVWSRQALAYTAVRGEVALICSAK